MTKARAVRQLEQNPKCACLTCDMEFENVRELVLSRQAERIYRTRTEIIVDALQISRIWGGDGGSGGAAAGLPRSLALQGGCGAVGGIFEANASFAAISC